MVDFEKVAPQKGSGMEPRTGGRSGSDADNPFLTKGWLRQSFTENQDYELPPIDGAFTLVPAKKGANKGEPVERLTGEAATVVQMIRRAADHEGLGVQIQYADPVYASGAKKGQPVPG